MESNLLTGLNSLSRLSRRDQRVLAERLRQLAYTVHVEGATSTTAAYVLRAMYSLDKA